MLCILFGVLVASLFWNWLDVWAAIPGLIAAAGLFLTLKFWPTKKPHIK